MKFSILIGCVGLLLVGMAGLNACTSEDNEPRPTEFRVITGEPDGAAPTATEVTLTQSASSPNPNQPSAFPSSTPLADVLWEGVVINGDAVLFAEPQTDASEMGIVPLNTRIQIYEETAPNRIGLIFYQIQYQNIVGWIASTQVQRADAVPTNTSPNQISSTLTPFPSATLTLTPSPTVTATSLPAGFPTPEVYSLALAEQQFERGRMLWLQPLRQIWVLVGDEIDPTSGTWQCFLDEFVDGQTERDPLLDPPAGITTASRLEGAVPIQPIRGFGKIWRDHADLREGLGWAITPETLYTTRYEYRAGGNLQAGNYEAAPGQYLIDSLYQYVIVLTEDTLRSPCETKRGTWHIE